MLISYMAFLYIVHCPEWWTHEDVFKVGFTHIPNERFSTYQTGSPYPVCVVRLWCVTFTPDRFKIINQLDKLLPYFLADQPTSSLSSFREGGGTEFYRMNDPDQVARMFQTYGFQLTKLDPSTYGSKPHGSSDVDVLIKKLFALRLQDHQKKAFDDIMAALRNSTGLVRGLLVMSVGSGKTRIGVALHEALCGRTLWRLTSQTDVGTVDATLFDSLD